ncbi:MAG: hypothetical protein M1834_005007 [Cirrosporium novae-zelandiae]|nr:MAG: hypothetical protein M1834_005007 [Cirrosporium novae-zelandiae]
MGSLGVQQASRFNNLIEEEADEAFAVNDAWRADPYESKVNLGVGVYRDNNAQPYTLPVVSKVEKALASDPTNNHEYIPILGLQPFLEKSRELIFGNDDPSLFSRIASVQTVSGTGANHIGARFLVENLNPRTVWISDPTWINHHLLWKTASHGAIKQKLYPYYDSKMRAINFREMMDKLEVEAEEGDVVLLHACAHNPTGLDPSRDQWKAIAQLCLHKNLFPFFDAAYIGFASGSPDVDAWAIRYFVSQGLETCVAQSFSKNFGLYGERVGAFHLVLSSSANFLVSKVLSQFSRLNRSEISTAPAHGAKIVLRILSDPALTAEWLENLGTMSSRIIEMRNKLYAELKRLGTPGTWEHIVQQNGMFSYTGANEAQVAELRDKYHIYMLRSGRACISGLNTRNVTYVAQAIDAVNHRGYATQSDVYTTWLLLHGRNLVINVPGQKQDVTCNVPVAPDEPTVQADAPLDSTTLSQPCSDLSIRHQAARTAYQDLQVDDAAKILMQPILDSPGPLFMDYPLSPPGIQSSLGSGPDGTHTDALRELDNQDPAFQLTICDLSSISDQHLMASSKPKISPIEKISYDMLLRTLKTYPHMIARRVSVPPIIHQLQISQEEIPLPLANCFALTRMWDGQPEIDGAGGLIKITILQEMHRLFDEYRSYNEVDLLAALQALLVYTIIVFSNSKCISQMPLADRINMIKDLQEVAYHLAKTGLKLKAERDNFRPNWEAWCLIEAKRRTILATCMFYCAYAASNGIPSFEFTDLNSIIATSSKFLWQASSKEQWEPIYNRYLAQWKDGPYLLSELMAVPSGEILDSRSEMWFEEVDEFGMMFMSLVALFSGGLGSPGAKTKRLD